MKTWLAIGVVITANSWLLLNAARNRASHQREMELTDREFQVVQHDRDNTALFLRLTYDRPDDWLNRAKLAELGFDTSRDPDDPDGKAFYRAVPPRPAFVASELRDRDEGSRLETVDAAILAETLTARYPDQSRYLIARGAVSIFITQSPNAAPIVSGNIRLLPQVVHVPLPPKPPLRRYVVKLRYGANWEPWVAELTLKP